MYPQQFHYQYEYISFWYVRPPRRRAAGKKQHQYISSLIYVHEPRKRKPPVCFSVFFRDFASLLPYEVESEIRFYFHNEVMYLLYISVEMLSGP